MKKRLLRAIPATVQTAILPAVLFLSPVAAVDGQQAKGGQQTKSAQQAKGGQQGKSPAQAKAYPPFKIDSASLEITEASDYSRNYRGIHSGTEYHARTSAGFRTDSEKRTYSPPSAAKWAFRTKINGHVKPVEFRPVSSKVGDIRGRGNDYYTKSESLWAFTPEEEGAYEIVATATYMDEAHSSDTIKLNVLPPRDWAAPISLFCNGEPVPGDEMTVGKRLFAWDRGDGTPPHAQGPVCVKWLTKKASGTFLDGGGDIRSIEIRGNNSFMDLDPGPLQPGAYTLSVPCEQEGPDGRTKTVTYRFKVNVW